MGFNERFKEIIEQIKKVPDNIFYWINKRYTKCETLGPDTYIDVTFSLYQQTGKDIKTRKYVRAIYDNVPYSTKLIEINAELEELYKDKINLKTKDNLLDTINGLLLQNQPFDLKDTTYEE